MSGRTSRMNIPYPTLGDKVADYPQLAQQAAELLDPLRYDGTLNPQPGWRAVGVHSGQTLRCRVVGGVAHLSGAIGRVAGGFTATAWKDYDIANVSPAPEYEVIIPACINLSQGVIFVRVDTRGIINIRYPSNVAIGSNTWICLDGITYRVKED